MDMRALVLALLRRWYLVVPALLLAGSSTYLTVTKVGPTYTAEASILLLPPPTISGEGPNAVQVNPYTSMGGLTPARDVLVHAMTSRSSREAMKERFPGSDFDLVPDVAVSGPLISVEVASSSEAEALALLNELTGRTPEQLVALQAGLKIDNGVQITAQTLDADQKAQIEHKAQIRAGIVTAAATLVILLLGICLLDGLLMSRRWNALAENADVPKLDRRARRATRGVPLGDGLVAGPPS